MRMKIFKCKAQMINYYNKLVNDPTIETAYMGYLEGAYRVMYRKRGKRRE